MVRDAIHRRGQTEKQPSSILCVFMNKKELRELQALSTICGGAEQTLVNGVNCQRCVPGTHSGIISKLFRSMLVSVDFYLCV